MIQLQNFSTYCEEAKGYSLKAANFVYDAVAILFDMASTALRDMKGLQKTVKVSLSLFAILHENLEESEKYIETLESLMENFKFSKKASSWIFKGGDLVKKDWIDSEKSVFENFINCTKLICLFAVSIINVCDFAYKMGWIGEISLAIGAISVKNILRTVVKIIALIKDCFTYSTLKNTEANLVIKKALIQDESVPQEKMKLLKEKFFNLKFGGNEEEFVVFSEGYQGTYVELKRKLTLKKAKVKVNQFEKDYNVLGDKLKVAEANEKEKLVKSMEALSLKIFLLKEDIHALKGITAKVFANYKLEQYHLRSHNLELRFWKFGFTAVCDIAKMITQIIGLSKSFFGLDALMDFFGISLESTAKTIIYTLSFISDDLGFIKFFYDKYSEKEKKEMPISMYVFLNNASIG